MPSAINVANANSKLFNMTHKPRSQLGVVKTVRVVSRVCPSAYPAIPITGDANIDSSIALTAGGRWVRISSKNKTKHMIEGFTFQSQLGSQTQMVPSHSTLMNSNLSADFAL